MAEKLHKSKQLAAALYQDDIVTAETLLEDGADPNLVLPSEGMAPLHYAAGMTSKKSLQFTRMLLGYGADPNTRSVDGLTPVHVAASWGRFQALQCLLANGGDPTLQDEEGQTALSLATGSDNWDCLDLLKQIEVDITEDEGEEDQRNVTYTRLRDITESLLADISDDENHSMLSEEELSQGDATNSLSMSVNSSSASTHSQNISGILWNRERPKERHQKRVSFFSGIPEVEESDSLNFLPNSVIEEELNGEIRNGAFVLGRDSDADWSLSSEELSFQELTLLEGQGLDVTSPDNTIIFYKRVSRDKRKTCMFSLLTSPSVSPVDLGIELNEEEKSSPVSHVLRETCSVLKDLDLNRFDSNSQLSRIDEKHLKTTSRHCSSEPSPTASVGGNLSIPEDLSKFISESSPNLSSEATPKQSPDKAPVPRSNKKCRSSMFRHLSPVGGDRKVSQEADGIQEFLYYDKEVDVGLLEVSLPSASNSFSASPGENSIVHHQDLHVQCANVSTVSNSTRSSDDTVLYDWKSFISDEEDTDNVVIMEELLDLNNSEINSRLRELGEEPGPITETTRRVYLILLTKILKDPDRERIKFAAEEDSFKHELAQVLSGLKPPDNLTLLEVEMVSRFQVADPKRKWREGILKSSFNYLLLDPRVSLNLPMRHMVLSPLEIFRIFVSAIFYVGKGKRARPYAHFYEALEELKKRKKKKKGPGKKVKHIREIWSAGLGVISLHIFQNVIPVEAYTREACMVDALTLQRLTNVKKGDYYGIASTWVGSKKRQMGVHLLQKACNIFLIEGERMIRPVDIKIGQ